MITLEQLCKAAPVAKLRAAQFIDELNKAMTEFEITTPLRQAAFLAQICHESENLVSVEEGLNYRAERLMAVWPKRFPTLEAAKPYANSPAKLANKVYANRMGNGDEASGDGYRHRGAGLIQLTGKDNQYRAAMYFDVDPETVCDWLMSAEGACRSAAWFWKEAGCNALADKGDFDGVSDLINIGRKTEKVGDAVGYAHRKSLYDAFKRVLGA